MHRNVCSYRQATIKPRAVNSGGRNERLRTLKCVTRPSARKGLQGLTDIGSRVTARFYDPLTHPSRIARDIENPPLKFNTRGLLSHINPYKIHKRGIIPCDENVSSRCISSSYVFYSSVIHRDKNREFAESIDRSTGPFFWIFLRRPFHELGQFRIFHRDLRWRRFNYLSQKRTNCIRLGMVRKWEQRISHVIRAMIHPFVHWWLYCRTLIASNRNRRLIYFSDVHGRRDILEDGRKTRYQNFIGMHGMSIRNLPYYCFCFIYSSAYTRESPIQTIDRRECGQTTV